jgi:hypothetical protein
MNLQKDLKEFVELLNELDVHFLVVGAFAVSYRDLLKRNKTTSGRTQDLADLEHL